MIKIIVELKKYPIEKLLGRQVKKKCQNVLVSLLTIADKTVDC